MPASYFERFVSEAVEGYSRDAVAAGRWQASEAEANSRAELDRFLPEGVQTPGHRVCLVETGEFEEPVGTLWYGEMEREGQQIAYVFDLRIYPEFRRRGYAVSALGEVELFARMRNLEAIGLHVFAHNEPARALYEKLGYRSESGLMFKRLLHCG
jgi:ribosomal protein S18 acetylase RimI-like enzyme